MMRGIVWLVLMISIAVSAGCGVGNRSVRNDGAEHLSSDALSALDGKVTCCLTLSPDGRMLLFEHEQEGAYQIYWSEYRDGSWAEPKIVPFGDGASMEGTPYFSPDGSQLYFTSTRPLNGRKDYNLWVVERTNDGWGEPIPLSEPINSPDEEYGPALASDGRILFNRKNADGEVEIWSAERTVDGYAEPQRLPESIHQQRYTWNRYVTPDGLHLFYSSSSRTEPESIWYSRYRDTAWSDPISISERLAIRHAIGSPVVTPDGNSLIYVEGYGGASKIHVVTMDSLGLDQLSDAN